MKRPEMVLGHSEYKQVRKCLLFLFFMPFVIFLLMYACKNMTKIRGFEKKTLYLHDFDKRNRINHNKI